MALSAGPENTVAAPLTGTFVNFLKRKRVSTPLWCARQITCTPW